MTQESHSQPRGTRAALEAEVETDLEPPDEPLEHPDTDTNTNNDNGLNGERLFNGPISMDEHLQIDHPPAYQPDDLPTYAVATTSHHPPQTYHLRQMSKKLQLLTPFSTSPASTPSYKIPLRGRASLFSKKPDMALLRTFVESPFLTEQRVAEMSFINDGPLPWMPRAKVTYLREDREAGRNHEECSMEARNFANWTIDMGDGRVLVWTQDDEPVSLVLRELLRRGRAGETVARFAYSRYGTKAENGGVIGELSVVGRRDSGGEETGLRDREKIIAGCLLVIEHWRRMGRHYRNPEAWGAWSGISRRDSVLTEMSLSGASGSSSEAPVERRGAAQSLSNLWREF